MSKSETSETPDSDNVFEGVVPALASALKKRGFETLTPVQQACLAPELEGQDLLVSAQTGSGKTVAFGIALASTLLEGKNKFDRGTTPFALAVAPTRELALQVKRELEWLYKDTGAYVVSCVGGMDMRDERRDLVRGAHIVVGTPGRLNDHIKRGSLDMSQIRAVVMDEADEMLDLGFREELEFILNAAPEDRRTLMFSATVSRPIATLAKNYQKNAVRVNTVQAGAKQHVDIEYRALTCAPQQKENAIINVLRFYDAKNAIVFCATRATVNHLTSRLNNRGFSVVALSGELSQKERSHALQAMRDGRAKVCVATDVAARGIDLPELDLVVHADLPKNNESLLHRSGRTGRAGRKGVSALIVPFKAKPRITRLLKDAKVTADWAKPPSAEDVTAKDNERLLADPALTEVVTENEKGFATQLLNIYAPEQIAAAFIRLYRKDHSAPEEIDDSPDPFEGGHGDRRDRGERRERKPRKPNDRSDFDDGVWISLNVGRNRNADPKWLIPLICKAGKLTKKDLGAIRIHQDETQVEIAPDSFADFIQQIGPDAKLDKQIRVATIDGKPPVIDAPARRGKPMGKTGGRKDTKKPFVKKGGKTFTDKTAFESKPKPKKKLKGYDKSVAQRRLQEKDSPQTEWSPEELKSDDGYAPRKKPGAAKKPKKGKLTDKNKGKPKKPLGKNKATAPAEVDSGLKLKRKKRAK